MVQIIKELLLIFLSYDYLLFFVFFISGSIFTEIYLNRNIFKYITIMSNKQQRGQFYTTNYKYILSDIKIPDGVSHIVEPFVGKGDLLAFIDNDKYEIETYDIDPKIDGAVNRDTLSNPPSYRNKYIITNPPYLARNKSKDKSIFDKYDSNDLFRCFISTLINDPPIGGILIIPLNFWTSTTKSNVRLRKNFLDKMTITHMNIFEEQVFDDTSYTVCSFSFIEGKNNDTIPIVFYPNTDPTVVHYKLINYTIGGDMYELQQNKTIIIERITKDNKSHENLTNIMVKCIDDSMDSPICASIVNEPYIDETDKLSARSYMSLIISPKIDKNIQEELVERFNKFITKKRAKYHSLFLTNYREGCRKRISFQMVYEIMNYLLTRILRKYQGLQ